MGGERDFRKTAVEKRASHPRGTERNEEEEEKEKEREREYVTVDGATRKRGRA